jgi:protein-S-isoprenylcysteine O-methyltransferase Ste14
MSQPSASPSDRNSSSGNRSGPEESDQEAPAGTILAPSPLLTLAAFLVGAGIEWVWPTQLLPWKWNLAVGFVLVAGGGLLFGAALWWMRRHGKHPSHADTPEDLITGGPYRWSRNPIYAGHSLAHAGGAFLIGSLWPLLTLVPVVLYLNRVIQREEARLRTLFGSAYDRYCQQVRRWL